jgi:hypothetical protein
LEEQLNPGWGGNDRFHPGTGGASPRHHGQDGSSEPYPGAGDGCSAAHGEHARDNDPAGRGHACCGSPGRDAGERTLSRISFIGAGLVASAGAFGSYVAQANADSSVQVWGLDPNWDGGDPSSCGCGGCASCRSHAANKWFASAALADAGRAHPHCRCAVVPLVQLSKSTYTALFAGGTGGSVDLRYQWVQAVLAHSGDTDAPEGQVADGVRAVVRPGVVQNGNGRRFLYIEVRSNRLVTASITITRDGRTLAHKIVKGLRGTRRIRIELPPHTRPGPARLRLKLSTSAARPSVVTRVIQIPRVLLASPPRRSI